MQTILGSGGAIGSLLAAELPKFTDDIRLVSRNPVAVNPKDQLVSADLTKRDEVLKAVEGSEIAYLTAGLPYELKIWRRDWPILTANVIEACLKHHTKLVFFDNVYSYSKAAITHMTEDSPVNPPSEKGKVRNKVLEMLRKAEQNGLKLLIVRAADFYGPGVKNSLIQFGIIEPLTKDQRAFWQADDTKIHSLTFTPDAAAATALLGNSHKAYGQVWHAPTSHERLTGKDYVARIAKDLGKKPRHFVMKKWMIGALGLFMPTLRELKEMQYQNDRDYFFDSSKIEKAFGLKPTSYAIGLAKTVKG